MMAALMEKKNEWNERRQSNHAVASSIDADAAT